jgi:hypothetical protein
MNVRILLGLIFACGVWSALGADVTKPLYENNFEKAAPGSVPEDFLVLEGAFAVKEEGGNKFLELPGSPLDTFGVLFGPTEKEGIAVSARIYGTAKGRRFPAFGVGLNGAGGYKLQISPAKKLVEIYRGDSAVASVAYEWESGKWTHLKLQVRKGADGTWNVRGNVWQEGTEVSTALAIGCDDKNDPPPGRASIWGSPYSGTPIRYDDLMVSRSQIVQN